MCVCIYIYIYIYIYILYIYRGREREREIDTMPFFAAAPRPHEARSAAAGHFGPRSSDAYAWQP